MRNDGHFESSCDRLQVHTASHGERVQEVDPRSGSRVIKMKNDAIGRCSSSHAAVGSYSATSKPTTQSTFTAITFLLYKPTQGTLK